MNTKILETIFKEKPSLIKELDKGITNDNYLVVVDGESYIVRIPPHHNQAVFDRALEGKAMQLVQPLNINIEPNYFDEKTGIKASPYLKDLVIFEDYHLDDRIERVAKLMKTLHQAKLKCGVEFKPLEQFDKYYRAIKTPLYDLTPFLTLLESVEKTGYNHVLCHNDWVSGNICFKKDKTYLIDYEYAKDNDPLFDVMSFITENKLTSQEKEEFLKHYFEGEIDDTLRKQLKMWEDFHNLLWLAWANMMYDKSHKRIFKLIAADKHSALTKQ